MSRSQPNHARACALSLALAALACARPPERLSGELAAHAESLVAAAGGAKLACTDWVVAGAVGKVRGCYVAMADGTQRFYYADTAGRVLSVGSNRSVSADSLYGAVAHSQMELSHQYGLPGECREGSRRAYFWHAPTHHAVVVVTEQEPAPPRSSVSVVLSAGPLSCGADVLYRSPAGTAAAS